LIASSNFEGRGILPIGSVGIVIAQFKDAIESHGSKVSEAISRATSPKQIRTWGAWQKGEITLPTWRTCSRSALSRARERIFELSFVGTSTHTLTQILSSSVECKERPFVTPKFSQSHCEAVLSG
jgi:hypothetical protein